MQLLFATQNSSKLRELDELLRPLGRSVELRSLADAGLLSQADETGSSFGQNALIKAAAAARAAGGWALADDSGLCVEVLDGAPGIHSARWSGSGDQANNALLLERLAGASDRRARYVCALALCHVHGEQLLVEAEVSGQIALQPRGSGGFGYDPLFEIPDWGATFAEVSADRKHQISHRAAAFRKLLPLLSLLSG